jgi:hypothetical protein
MARIKCEVCGITKRVHTMFTERGYTKLCPKHALELRNKVQELPEGTPFEGKIANKLYQEQMEEEQEEMLTWRSNHDREKAKT